MKLSELSEVRIYTSDSEWKAVAITKYNGNVIVKKDEATSDYDAVTSSIAYLTSLKEHLGDLPLRVFTSDRGLVQTVCPPELRDFRLVWMDEQDIDDRM